jgi:hypothetical protein
VHGIHSAVLVSKPASQNSPFTTQWLYVDTATGLPLQIGYQSDGRQHVTAFFGNWGHVTAVTAPPASKVVAG